MTDNLISSIGRYCRVFRMIHLDKTLREVASASSSNEKSLSSFEHGRANNIQHLICYIMSCESTETRDLFYAGLTVKLMEHHREMESAK
jgi:hypothetical protein